LVGTFSLRPSGAPPEGVYPTKWCPPGIGALFMIYADHAATTPIRREVLEAMWPYLTNDFGNPSSHHDLGARAARALTDARARIAANLHCRPSEIVFTSGATESDNLAIKGIALANPASSRKSHRILTTPIEHEAVLQSCDYLHRHHAFSITQIPVDPQALIDPAAFAAALTPDTTLCTIMLANNEVGTTQPIADLAEQAHAHKIPFHTDAVQAAGSLNLNVEDLNVDALSIAGHKLGAPRGTGLLYLSRRLQIEPLLHGGGQERNHRSGTENVAAAIALATALELATADLAERAQRLSTLRDQLIQGILKKIPTAILTGHPTQRLPGNASFCFPQTSGEAMLLQLEERGILCSSGSACAAGSDQPSHVLLAMGIPPAIAQTAVRFSLDSTITEADIATVSQATAEAHQALTGPA
jgi:cysteine desulfurase